MVRYILLNEFLKLVYSRKFQLCFLVIIILFGVSSLLNVSSYKHKNRNHQLLSQNTTWVLEKKEIHPFFLFFKEPIDITAKKDSLSLLEATFGYQRIVSPPSKLSFISNGLDHGIPNSIDLNYYSISTPKISGNHDFGVLDFKSIDWSFIIGILISLICIIFSYDSFSKEYSDGTYKLIFSNSIKKWEFFLGKYLSIILVILSILFPAILLNLVITISSGISLFTSDFVLIGYYLINIVFFISLNTLLYLFISMNTNKINKSISLSLLFWLFFCIIFPNSSWTIGKKTSPVSSKSQVIQQEENALIVEKSLSWGHNNHVNNDILEYKDDVDKNTFTHNKIWRNYTYSLFNQYKVCQKISNISPFAIFQMIGSKISNTGVDGYIDFYEQVLSYQNVLQDYIRGEDQKDKNSSHLFWNKIDTNQGYISNGKLLINNIPRFKFKPLTYQEVFKITNGGFIILICWNIGLLALIILQLNKTKSALNKRNQD